MYNIFNVLKDANSISQKLVQHSTRLINQLLTISAPTDETHEIKSHEITKDDSYWGKIPLDLKINVMNFLNRREITMLTRVNHQENNNKISYLLANLARNPDQIKTNDDFIIMIAQLLKLKFKDIHDSEKFETLFIQFIQKLDKNKTPFLIGNIDVTQQAHFKFISKIDRISFQYKEYPKKAVVAMANVLEEYFPGVNTKVAQLEENEPYWLSIDKKIFLQKILPWLFEKEVKLEKQKSTHEPKVSNYAPTKRYYVTKRSDGKPLTNEDTEKLMRAACKL